MTRFHYRAATKFEHLAFSAVVECTAAPSNVTYQAAHEDGFATRREALERAQRMAGKFHIMERTRRLNTSR